ncbi:hypothetical protein EUGRSUZ_F03824 [Eucalyptus grandis]|uniref:Uncharacterized protein n=2 Tax=Eucalyptus grandis TaxID=71139 RepID=A0ACC3KMW2_EUCGR|nr:hypothetical protein EUGRSUZ_F03824 [Eucalyptus grandis]
MANQHPDNQAFGLSLDIPRQGSSKSLDDDGRVKRTGTVWTASAHIITAVIGSGVLSLAWATAQLGWIAGPIVMFLFASVTYYTSTLLAACYRSGDPITGRRNYTYMDAVNANLGGFKVKLCGLVQYLNLFGVAIGYTMASSFSMMAIDRSNCFHKKGEKNPCHANGYPYMIAFGITEIIFSQIPSFDQLWWLSIVAAIMSFTYSTIGLGLGIAKVAETGEIRGSLTGISVGNVTSMQKVWRSFMALGDIAFANSYSLILIEIQDTVRSPPSESQTMKMASLVSIAITTLFYLLCGCMGYAAFGDMPPGNLLTGFGFYNPYWMVDIANAAVVIHLASAYQVYCQPLFAFVEDRGQEIQIPIPGLSPYKLNLFRLVWRTAFVIVTTMISMLLPFFIHIVRLPGPLGFWRLAVYFPIEMYIKQQKIPKWSTEWVCLQILNVACHIIAIAAVAGSVAGVVLNLKSYKP